MVRDVKEDSGGGVGTVMNMGYAICDNNENSRDEYNGKRGMNCLRQ